jgi:hypothetical protein
MCYLQELGLRAARDARRLGTGKITVCEGPFPAVNTWEPWIWDQAAASMAPLVTGWQYAEHARLLTGNGDAGFTADLERNAIALAALAGVPLSWAHAPGGMRPVLPDWIWSVTADAMARQAARYGDTDLSGGGALEAAASGHYRDDQDSREPGGYGDVTVPPF